MWIILSKGVHHKIDAIPRLRITDFELFNQQLSAYKKKKKKKIRLRE